MKTYQLNIKKGQISVEYLILMGFITLIVITLLVSSLFYSSIIRDKIKFNQLEAYSNKITSSSEEVYYSGVPSKTVINAYLPDGVKDISVIDREIIFSVSSSSGVNVLSFESRIPLEGNLSSIGGVKRITITAEEDKVHLVEG